MTKRAGKSICDTCQKPLVKVKTRCGCNKYQFCDNTCYSLRPMRQSHREECERKKQEKLDAFEARKKAARSEVKSNKAKGQPRDANGQFASPEQEESPEEREKREKRNVHSKTSKIKKKLVHYSRKLDKLRKPWSICVLVHKTEERSRSDPVLYKSKNFVSHGPPVESQNLSGETSEGGRQNDVDLSIGEINQQAALNQPRRPNYRCYICNERTGPKKGFVCGGSEGSEKCINGAACRSCINIDRTSFSKAEMTKIELNWRCPVHKNKSAADESDCGMDEDTLATEGSGAQEKVKKIRKIPIYKISLELRLLLPADIRMQETFTRTELVKGVHAYIKENPALKVRDETTKKNMIYPDERLAKVYGTEAFEALAGVQKFGAHTKLINNHSPTGVTDCGPSSSPTVEPSTSSDFTKSSYIQGSKSTDSSDSSDSSDSDTSESEEEEKPKRSPRKFMQNPNRHRTIRSPQRLPNPPKSKKSRLMPNSTPNSYPSKISVSSKNAAPTSLMSKAPVDSSQESPQSSAPNSPLKGTTSAKNCPTSTISPLNCGMAIAPASRHQASVHTESTHRQQSTSAASQPKISSNSAPKQSSTSEPILSETSQMKLSAKDSGDKSMMFHSTQEVSKMQEGLQPVPPPREENCETCDGVLDYNAVGEDQVVQCHNCLKYKHESCQRSQSCKNCLKLVSFILKNPKYAKQYKQIINGPTGNSFE